MSQEDCIFCSIIAKKMPSNILYESDKVIAFLDIFPLSLGHFLVIPKTHAMRMHDIPDEELSEIPLVIKSLVNKAGIKDYNILQNNGKIAHQVVEHVHFHMIPKNKSEDGLVMEWNAKKATDEELEISINMYS